MKEFSHLSVELPNLVFTTVTKKVVPWMCVVGQSGFFRITGDLKGWVCLDWTALSVGLLLQNMMVD